MGVTDGAQAKEFMADLVFAREVKMLVRGTDRYKRTLGEVSLSKGVRPVRGVSAAGGGTAARTIGPVPEVNS